MTTDIQVINALRGLVIDGVHKAQSGHPGGAMSSMDFAYLLFSEYLQFDPDDPTWLGRDRFILSAGHESMLLYALLHYQGLLPLDELKQFRQYGSKTPGHPEIYTTEGVECSTGPLGQGAAMSVGLAIAANHFRVRLDEKLFQQRMWVLMGDGCMQTGVALGAASYAGHLKLKNLIWYYDRNSVQISGPISRTNSDDFSKIFEGFGWQVYEVDGNNVNELKMTIDKVLSSQDRPTLIIGNSIIGKGSYSMEGLAAIHGAPLPDEERRKTKIALGLPENQDFYVPEATIQHFRRRENKLRDSVRLWKQRLAGKKADDVEFASLYHHSFKSEDLPVLSDIEWNMSKKIATRQSFGRILEVWAKELPNLIGGSADLEPSNGTSGFAKIVGDLTAESYGNRNLAYGVREFPMASISNGLALFGGLIPFDATFLTFADYARPALRLGAIQKTRVIHAFTHDSFYVGEDGPTHQPIEHLMSLRAIPDLYVLRPADSVETEVLFRQALTLDSSSVLCLTRQNVAPLPIPRSHIANAKKGAYAILDPNDPDLLILATGSEVGLALEVAGLLKDYKIRVISMPCLEIFDLQEKNYREQLLPSSCTKRISIEAGITLGWQKYTGLDGLNIGLDRFGDSAPAEVLSVKYGFTAEAIASKIIDYLG